VTLSDKKSIHPAISVAEKYLRYLRCTLLPHDHYQDALEESLIKFNNKIQLVKCNKGENLKWASNPYLVPLRQNLSQLASKLHHIWTKEKKNPKIHGRG
jgi:hypothetical protein